LFFPFPDEREKDNPLIGGGYSAFMGHNGGLILIAHLSCQYTTGFLCELCLPRSSGRWYWGAFARDIFCPA